MSGLASDARYALVDSAARGMLLIDDHTGRRTTLTPPTMCGGHGDLVGGGWVLTSCVGYGNPAFQLYSIATGRWTAVTSSGGMPVAIGSDWIEFYGPSELGCSEHCSYQYQFRNIATGQLLILPTWAPGAITIPDLNLPGLAAPLCSPLQVPQGFPEDETVSALAPEPLAFAGPFAAGIEWYMHGGLWELRLLLERCGSGLHRVVTNQISSADAPQFAINNHALVWLSGGTIDGVFLPSLQRFKISGALRSSGRGPVPPTGIYGVFLTSRTLYIETSDGVVMAAASPRPRTHHSRPKR